MATKEIKNGTKGTLKEDTNFGSGEFFPKGTSVEMFNNIQDEYTNVNVNIIGGKHEGYTVRIAKIDWADNYETVIKRSKIPNLSEINEAVLKIEKIMAAEVKPGPSLLRLEIAVVLEELIENVNAPKH